MERGTALAGELLAGRDLSLRAVARVGLFDLKGALQEQVGAL